VKRTYNSDKLSERVECQGHQNTKL